ncbi:MAG: flagellar hook-associated protein FlgL [Gammaproteobacteria bacterium]
MRVSTVQLQREAIQTLQRQQSDISELQQQIASGRRILRPSDNPLDSASIILLNQRIARNEQLQQNAEAGETRLQLAESALSSTTLTLQRVRELQIRATSSILSNQDRQSILEELNVLNEELVGLANIQDANGEFLFSGFQANVRPYTRNSSGDFVYNGDSGQRFSEVASGLRVAISDSGQEIFGNNLTGNGFFSAADAGGNNTGSGVISAGSVINPSAYVRETYTITFVTNSASELAYQVVGSTSGQLIPALPAVTPADAPAYVDGGTINFNGIEINIRGTPAVGDDFQLTPSVRTNIFETIDNLTAALELNGNNPAEQARMFTTLEQTLSEIDTGLETILERRASIGARLTEIEDAQEINSNFTLLSQEALSGLQDVDYARAISEFQLRATAIEASQQTFIRIQSLNLFNFI